MRVYVSSTALFSTNAWMRLLLDNGNNQLLSDLNSYLTVPDASQNNRADLVQFNFRVTQVRQQQQQHCCTYMHMCMFAATTAAHCSWESCFGGREHSSSWALVAAPAAVSMQMQAQHLAACTSGMFPKQASCSRSQSSAPATASAPLVLLQIGPDYIDFDRPLSVNVSTSWNPEIHTWAAYTRTEVGIEKLAIECPWTAYAGMNREQGWNALNFWWTPHSWVDNVSILNAGAAQCCWAASGSVCGGQRVASVSAHPLAGSETFCCA
jgi:hypothetical protein